MPEPLYFDFYGVIVRVDTGDEDTAQFVASDFSWFRSDPPPCSSQADFTLSVHYGRPPFERIGEGTLAVLQTKDAIVYKRGSVKYYDTFGKTLVIHDFSTQQAEIHSLDRDILLERTYLMISSQVGDILDKRHMHRIHAMGVVYDGRGVVCLMPSGGGKTTLTLSLLGKEGFGLLSEEIPLLSSDGTLHPFPIRMGVTADQEVDIPGGFLRDFQRTHYGPKTLIDVRYFAGRIAPSAAPGIVFVGRRIYSSRPRAVPVSRLRAFVSLYRYCVMGVGLPQMLEYILRFDFLDMGRAAPILFSRLIASIRLVAASRTFELHLGTDRTANADFVADFVKRTLQTAKGKTR